MVLAMRKNTFLVAFVAVSFLALAGCAKNPDARVGIETAGLISQTTTGTYLYDANGNKRYQVQSQSGFTLPYEQCAQVRGRTDNSTNPPTLLVTGYETMQCR